MKHRTGKLYIQQARMNDFSADVERLLHAVRSEERQLLVTRHRWSLRTGTR